MHIDMTISLGNIIMSVAFLFAGGAAWSDMNWRVKNLETWRKEHMLDADSRDQIIRKLDKVLDHLSWKLDKQM